MNVRLVSFIILSALCVTGTSIYLTAREDLILSLEEVLGEPPDRSEFLENRKRDTFYSVVGSERDSEIEELIDQESRGIILTGEDQELVREYRMSGSSVGANAVLKRIYPPVLGWVESRVKVASGERYTFMKCTARADGPFPTALVLDPEIGQQKEAGMDEYHRIVRRMSVEAELPWEDSYRGRYATHSPLGNILTAHTVSVILPLNETLENANDISIEDWKSVIDFYLKDRDVEPSSFFLVATKEMADLAIMLAAAYPFTGLILEEPEQALFGETFPSDLSDAVAMTSLQNVYKEHLQPLTSDTYIFRHRLNSAIPQNDQLLLKPLIEWKRPLYLGMTDVAIRRISQEDVEKGVPEPRFLYDTAAAQKITQRILYFIQQQGNIALRILPEESTEPRSSNRASSLINQFEQANQRLNQLMSEAGAGGDSFDVSGGDTGGDDGGEL